MAPRLRAWALVALTCATASLHAQTTGALPDDWFDADEWHLQVRYILTAGELTSYQRVTTETQRAAFVDRFWKRRDSNPRTARNEYRDEFERRLAYANEHFADPSMAPHLGYETDRGRIHVLLGAPAGVEHEANSTRETWTYSGTGQSGLSFEFVLPAEGACDGSYRVLSQPRASFRGSADTVRVYAERFITARIPVDFTRAASVRHSLAREDGRPVDDLDSPIFGGQIGPAGTEPLSRHFLKCRMYESDAMSFTHRVTAGTYRFTSAIQWLDGRTTSDAVAFRVP